MSSIDYSKTGTKVIGRKSKKIGVVLRIMESGSVQVLERVEPYVMCTYDNYSQLVEIEDGVLEPFCDRLECCATCRDTLGCEDSCYRIGELDCKSCKRD